MGKKHTKKLNPRHIPIAKRDIDRNQIVEEATKNDYYHVWLLVFNAWLTKEKLGFEEIPGLTEQVNAYIKKPACLRELNGSGQKRAERLIGIPCPYENLKLGNVKPTVELEAFKRKLAKLATHTALCALRLGLESTGKYADEDLRSIFFDVDLTLAEIDHGTSSYVALEKQIASYGVALEWVDNLQTEKNT